MGNVSLLRGWQQHHTDVVTTSMTIVLHCIRDDHIFSFRTVPFMT